MLTIVSLSPSKGSSISQGLRGGNNGVEVVSTLLLPRIKALLAPKVRGVFEICLQERLCGQLGVVKLPLEVGGSGAINLFDRMGDSDERRSAESRSIPLRASPGSKYCQKSIETGYGGTHPKYAVPSMLNLGSPSPPV